MTAPPRRLNYAELALAHVFAARPGPELPPPPPLPPLPARGSVLAYDEAADAARDVLRQARQALCGSLTPEQAAYLEVIERAARQVGTCQERARSRRTPQTDQHQSVQRRLAHVALRLWQHYELDVSVEQLHDLQGTWWAAPAVRCVPGSTVRQVTFQGRVLYPLYQVLPTGAHYLTTVLKEAPLD